MFELEQEFYFDIRKVVTGKSILHFQAECFTRLQGDGNWGTFDCTGTEKVELSTDEESVLVYAYGSTEPKVLDLPKN